MIAQTFRKYSAPGTLLGLLVAFASGGASTAFSQLEYVDPRIGNVGHLLEPTRPTVSLPNSMVRVYPVRKDGLDDCVESFPLTIISHRMGELFRIMPCPEEPAETVWTRRWPYDQEESKPNYCSLRLSDSLVRIEFAPAGRAGVFRFQFPSRKAIVLIGNRQGGTMTFLATNAVSGTEEFNGMKAYVYGEFNEPVQCEATRGQHGSRLTISSSKDAERLEFRYGISFISHEQARQNLLKEMGGRSLEEVARSTGDAWNRVLGQVRVEGGTLAQKRVFYTALYRCYERMVNITEDGQYYSAFDHQVHPDARPFYTDNWLWDTYRALEPLQTLLHPSQQADKIQSYVRMFEQSGWMPSFAVLWGDHACMTGNHAAAWIADAWFKGVRNFDLAKAYEGLRKNSLEATILPWRNGPKTSLDDFYNEHGYLPALRPGEKETVPEVHSWERRQSVAVTLEQSYDDWCIAQLAKELGRADDATLFLKRSGNYRNLWRSDKGFMWPKDERGNWIEPFDPKFSGGAGGRDYTTENNMYTYNWDVQHDFAGLVQLMGGPKAAEARLDELFRTDLGRSKYEFFHTFPDSTGLVGQFSMGNEPSFATPYIYNHLGVPWKTQNRVRQLLECWFTDTALGIPGDEDGGGMSAFVVFSMMGFYPVVPGDPVYELGSPVFEKVTVRLENGKKLELIAKNASRSNKYVTRIALNRKPQTRVFFRHADLVNGARIDLQMSDIPNRDLGSRMEDLPPSSRSLEPTKFYSVSP